MLLAREKKIVTLLIEHEDKLTTTQIATSLKVSSRTIKADIKKINEELEKHSCRINSQQGVGLWIEYDNHEAKKYLKEVTRDTADLYLSPEVRKYHLAVELLLQDDYTSMEALAKEYYISKATVLNDLNELDELWEHYGVHFIKKVKYGIKVEGNEKFTVKYGFNPTEDEIGFITFYIGTSIERMKQKQHQKFTATLVCMTGFGTSQFLRAKLAGSFSNLEIREVFSASRLSEIKLEKQDFVIATVPIELEGIPVIQVSPVLSETDIKKIQKFLMKKKEYEPETQKNYEYLQQFLHSEIAMFDCDLKSKEEVIHLLGSRMITEGYVDEGFIDSVFERENLSETALGNLIAIPHAFEGHIKKQGIGIMTLKKPINWGDEKVQLIFLLSLDVNSKDYIKGIFGDVLELTKDKKAMEVILKARRFSEMFR